MNKIFKSEKQTHKEQAESCGECWVGVCGGIEQKRNKKKNTHGYGQQGGDCQG